MKQRDDKRTTVSLAKVVWGMAEEMMAAKGFNDNFSAYVADLVRRDQERQAQLPPVSSAPAHSAGTSHPVKILDEGILQLVGSPRPPARKSGSPRPKARSLSGPKT